jgi:hypothetical protein
MKALNLLLKMFLVFVTLTVTTAISGMIFPVKMTTLPNAALWWLASNAIVASALTFIGAQSSIRGWRLAIILSAIPLATQLANLIEGVFFLGNSFIPWMAIARNTAFAQLLATPCWMGIFRDRPSQAEPQAATVLPLPGGRLWRFLVADGLYLFLYFFAGMLVIPYVQDFYRTQTIPPFKTIIGLQLLLRGPLFAAICILLTRMFRITERLSVLKVGLVFTTLSGVAALIVPNPLFPDSVRWYHFCEVVSSNFVFGSLVALLWKSPVPAAEPAADREPELAAHI